ncbi:unnamed protein product, partial [Ectocarpus sp. 8 AP-2014]
AIQKVIPSVITGQRGLQHNNVLVLQVFRTSSAEMRGLTSAKEFDLVRRTCFPKQLRMSAAIRGVDFGQGIGCL